MSTEKKYINQALSKPISQLDFIDQNNSSNLFALFRTLPGNTDSYKLSYRDFIQQIVIDLSAKFHLSSMAFCETYDYAVFNHQHQYSNVNCYPGLLPSNMEEPLCLMKLSIDNDYSDGFKELSIYVPKLKVQPIQQYDIGDARFLAISNLTAEYGNINVPCKYIESGILKTNNIAFTNVNKNIFNSISSGTFDGWVYPDGTEYYKIMGDYDFSEAYKKFNGTNNRFKIPCLSNFIKLNPGIQCSNALAKFPGQTGIIEHSHTLNTNITGTNSPDIIATIIMNQSKDYDNKPNTWNTLHKAKKDGEYFSGTNISVDNNKIIPLTLRITSDDKKFFTYKTDSNDETYPNHYLIPVQVYIGCTKMTN